MTTNDTKALRARIRRLEKELAEARSECGRSRGQVESILREESDKPTSTRLVDACARLVKHGDAIPRKESALNSAKLKLAAIEGVPATSPEGQELIRRATVAAYG